jgi:hypothetical protein
VLAGLASSAEELVALLGLTSLHCSTRRNLQMYLQSTVARKYVTLSGMLAQRIAIFCSDM